MPSPIRNKKRGRHTAAPSHRVTNVIRRGDIFFVFDDPNHKPYGSEMWPNRPAVVISNDKFNKYSNVVEVVYITSTPNKENSPTHVPVNIKHATGTILCEQVHTIDKSRLSKRIAVLPANITKKVNIAVSFQLGLIQETSLL